MQQTLTTILCLICVGKSHVYYLRIESIAYYAEWFKNFTAYKVKR